MTAGAKNGLNTALDFIGAIRMVVIRLSRGGAKKRPFYRVVVADHRRSRDGRFIELVGTFDPRAAKAATSLKMDRIEHWLKLGAQPSETVGHLLKGLKTA